jgi:hypothetical protein
VLSILGDKADAAERVAADEVGAIRGSHTI